MEKALIEKIIAGDKRAFRELYEEYADYAIRTAIAITRNQEIAKDAVQETFIRVYRNLSNYDTSMPFGPWFYRILTNECNRLLKKESKMSRVDHPDLENDPHLAEDPKESCSDLYGVIQTLSDMYRIPLILKYLKGFTEKEIAKILDLNLNTVKSRLFKGRDLLKRQLQLIEKEEA